MAEMIQGFTQLRRAARRMSGQTIYAMQSINDMAEAAQRFCEIYNLYEAYRSLNPPPEPIPPQYRFPRHFFT